MTTPTELAAALTIPLRRSDRKWGIVRLVSPLALVGSHEEVANLIYEYHSLGFDEFILSGYPHLEEAYWFAEGVLPLLRHKGVA